MLEYTDIVLLDIKNFDPDVFKAVTSVSLDHTLQFLDYLKEKNITTWVRYVLVPGLTDNIEAIEGLANHLKNYPNVVRIELLPFHKMGEYKWKELDYEYTLSDTKEPTKELVTQVKAIFESSSIPVYATV